MSKSGNLTQLSAIFSNSESPTIYYTEDPPFLPRILVLYWPVQAVGSFASTSRIRVTILSAAGFKSYGAFSVAPSSSHYAAVHKLPEDKQRDDVCRGIAFALCRYFSEVSPEVKNAITDENLHHGIGLRWGPTHAAQVTGKMSKVINVEEVIDTLRPFLKERPSSVPTASTPVRPTPSIRKTRPSFLPPDPSQPNSFGKYTTPSKRISSYGTRRSPSASTTKKAAQASAQKQVEQQEGLRFKMCEFVDTEDRYITRLQELTDLVLDQGRTAKSISSKSKPQKTVNAMLQFPSLLDQIKDLNLAFLDDIESVLQSTEGTAIAYIDQSAGKPADASSQTKDPVGIYAFAKVLLNHFPKFPMPYRSYLDLHSQISSNLDEFLQDGASSIQIAPSLLMEPAQRISRYGLYIDTMLQSVPPTSNMAIRTLEKARKIIADICEMEPAASAILDSLRIEHEAKKRSLSPTKLISGLTRGGTAGGTIREAPARAPATTATTATTSSSSASFLMGGSLRERDTPKLLPSLSRSFSRKNRSRPGLAGILSEQNPEHVNNVQTQRHNDENVRPKSNGSGTGMGGFSGMTGLSSISGAFSLRGKFRPDISASHGNGGGNGSGLFSPRPSSKDSQHNNSNNSNSSSNNSHLHSSRPTQPRGHDAVGGGGIPSTTPGVEEKSEDTIEHYRAQIMKLEQENYNLLAENAELKRRARECRCGGTSVS